MPLPAIEIPKIELPFDIPFLLHPPIDHFVIALPVIVLILELSNLIVKKRAIGITSFFLLLFTVVAAVAAYLTGSVDGKEAFPLLNEMAQNELKEHKLLGTYLMLASVVVVVFKLLASLMNRKLMKALYLLILILFVGGILNQGKEGGELVYTYGVNVQKVQVLDDEIFDLKEELEELQEEMETISTAKTPAVKSVTVQERATETVEEKIVPTKEEEKAVSVEKKPVTVQTEVTLADIIKEASPLEVKETVVSATVDEKAVKETNVTQKDVEEN